MADTVTNDRILKMGFLRSDESVQYINVPQASDSLDATTIRGVMTYLTQNRLIVDSKTDAVFSETSIFTANVTDKTTVTLDLT